MGVQMFDPFITLAQHILWCKEWMRNSLFSINEQIQNIAQKKDTLCRRMYN